MPTPKELQDKFWSDLKSDMTTMIGLNRIDDGHTRPMTAQIARRPRANMLHHSAETDLVKSLPQSDRAIATFSASRHNLFATVHGPLVKNNDKATIDHLWNRFIAAWFEKGKDDPKFVLLRLDAEEAKIWEAPLA